MVCPLDHPRSIIHIRVRNIAHHDPQFAPIINSSLARIESEFGHMQFTIDPPGFELSSIHEELSLDRFKSPLSNVFLPFGRLPIAQWPERSLYFLNGNV